VAGEGEGEMKWAMRIKREVAMTMATRVMAVSLKRSETTKHDTKPRARESWGKRESGRGGEGGGGEQEDVMAAVGVGVGSERRVVVEEMEAR
jgi:hypothetical protein